MNAKPSTTSNTEARPAEPRDFLKAARLFAYARKDAFDKDLATKRKATLAECLIKSHHDLESGFCEETDEVWLWQDKSGKTLGALWLRVEDLPWEQTRQACLLALVVHPKHRSKGLGTTLAKHFLERSRERGAALFRLLLRADNTAGLNLARKLGFFTEGFQLVARAGLSGPEARKKLAKEEKERTANEQVNSGGSYNKAKA